MIDLYWMDEPAFTEASGPEASVRHPLRFALLSVSMWLGGCLGEGTGPSGSGNPTHPLHGSWYTDLHSYGSQHRYAYMEFQYHPNGRQVSQSFDFHRDSLTGRLVLDSVIVRRHRVAYSIDGDIVTLQSYRAEHDTVMGIQQYQIDIRGDSLHQRICYVLRGPSPVLEGRWELSVSAEGSGARNVTEFRGGMRYDTLYEPGKPAQTAEPTPYRLLNDSTFVQDRAEPWHEPDTLVYRLRKGRLELLTNMHMEPLSRTPPAI